MDLICDFMNDDEVVFCVQYFMTFNKGGKGKCIRNWGAEEASNLLRMKSGSAKMDLMTAFY